jgi:hypothetical protein
MHGYCDDLLGPGVNELAMTAFAGSVLNEARRLQSSDELTPGHTSRIT